MTKHNQPQGIGKASRTASRKIWSIDGDRGKSAHALVNDPKVKVGNKINVYTANQWGSMQYKVVRDKKGKKSLKVTYDPKSTKYDTYSGGKGRKTRKNRK